LIRIEKRVRHQLIVLSCITVFCGQLNLSFSQNKETDSLLQVTGDTSRIFTVNRILIIGNKRTRDAIISRELSLKPSDTIRARKLTETLLWDKRKLYNLRLFNVVTVRSLQMSANTIDLLVEVEERWYTWPVPIFELSDRNFNEWWQTYNHDLNRVNFGIRLDQFNFRGRNETVQLTAQFGFTQRFGLRYSIPYIDKRQKQGLGFNFEYGNPKNIDYFTKDHRLLFLNSPKPVRVYHSGGIEYTYRKSFFETHSLSLSYNSAQVSDTIAILNPIYFTAASNRQRFFNLSYTFKSEHRDVVMYPLKGYQFTGHVERTGFGIEGPINQWVLSLTYAYHRDLQKGYYFSNFASAFLSTPSEQPYSFYGALGYQRQLVRGYEVFVIQGPKFFVDRTTLKKKIFSKVWNWNSMPLQQFRYLPFAVYLKSFLDVGYVENYPYYESLNLNTRLSNKLLAGYGGGVDFVFPYDAVLRIEYTFTREGTQGFFFNLKKEF
jgi:outer membrane protein assembly factor BamA